MQTPPNKAGHITERIMFNFFSRFNDNSVIVLEGEKYNRVYEKVYDILKCELEKDRNKNDIFVKHIEDHLKKRNLKNVICRICGKTIDEIYKEPS